MLDIEQRPAHGRRLSPQSRDLLEEQHGQLTAGDHLRPKVSSRTLIQCQPDLPVQAPGSDAYCEKGLPSFVGSRFNSDAE